MKNILWITAITLIGFISCKKEIETLPEPTQSGANTFGAKVDGVNWGPLKASFIPASNLLDARFGGNNSIYITGRNFSRSPEETEMEIYLQNVTGPGTYLLNQNTERSPGESASYGYFLKRKFTPQEEWITSAQHTGKVEVTRFDIANRIIAGTFEFTAGAKYSSAPIQVTEGRFDVKLQ